MNDVYLELREEVKRFPQKVCIVAVTKYATIDQMKQLYQSGCRDFGENKVQTALEKMSLFPSDVKWHLIGSCQRNKVNKILGKFHLVHSVDKRSLAEEISEKSKKAGIQTRILLQVNIGKEETKHGFTKEELMQEFASLLDLQGISIEGLMTMAPNQASSETIHQCFYGLRNLRNDLRKEKNNADILPELSMGMSQDYREALEAGATLLRIGSALFGS